MFKTHSVNMSMSRFKKTFNLGDSTPLELVDQSGKNTIFGCNLREAIYRFSPSKKLRSADLTVFATVKNNERQQTLSIAEYLKKKLNKSLGKGKIETPLCFPNGRKINIVCWETAKARIYLWHSTALTPNDADFVSLRWEAKSLYKRKKYFTWYVSANPYFPLQKKGRGKIVIVPHRKQSDITGQCAPTVVSRQLAQCGSEIPPVIWRAFWDKIGEGKAKDQMSKIFGFKHESIDFGIRDVAGNCVIAIEEYNKLAKKSHKKPINFSKKDNSYGWGDNFVDSDPKLWSMLKKVNYSRYDEFRKYIIKNIDNNIPLSWTVKRHNGRGKHRRMIIGYDTAKDIIYFSDTWGGGTNVRTMPFRAAFVMSVWFFRIYCSGFQSGQEK